MRHVRFDISLGILIPFITGGSASLAVLLSDQLTRSYPALRADANSQFFWLCAFTGLITFMVALLMLGFMLRPIRRFLREAEKIPVLQEPAVAAVKPKGTEMEAMDHMFGQVTMVLESLDAKALFPQVIGGSRAIRGLLAQVQKVAPSEATVLLTGESGTGKDLLATSVHGCSKRKDKIFVALNCAAIPHGLLESVLFGHEKGAFTGAVSAAKGKFEQASGGTLFLDEIGDMPLETQAKILRALETGEAERLGGRRPVRFDVRLVAATNKNLPKMIEEGTFREDLFHRLNVFPIHLPPLREHPEDIPVLANHFLESLKPGLTMTPQSLQLLMAYAWPGNVRELRNTLERASVLVGDNGPVTPEHLPKKLWTGSLSTVAPVEPSLPGGRNIDEQLDEFEKRLVSTALLQSGGVQARAARLLGIKERSLWHRVKKFSLDPSAYKTP